MKLLLTIKAVATVLLVGGCSASVWAQQNISYTYNDNGQILTEDGPRTDVSDVTTYTYDAVGNRASMTNALGQVTNYTQYDASGHLLSMVDPNGITSVFTYDDRGRLLSSRIKHPSNSTLDVITQYAYDAVGQLTGMVLPNGYVLNYYYDDAHRLIAIANANGERIEYSLDAAGNRTAQQIKSSNGVIVYSLSQAFDELSRVMNVVGNHGQNNYYQYDANDNPISVTDGRSNASSKKYDALNRVAKTIDPKLKETNFTYDSQNRIKTVTDARGNATTYSYDGLGNLISLSSPDAGTTIFTYDLAGNRISAKDARGIVVNYTYDALNRLTSVTYPASPAENVTYTYDSAANGSYGIGRLSSISSAINTITYSYNYQGLTGQKQVLLNGKMTVTSYKYDLAGNLVEMTYPSGRIVTYGRDSAGRIQSIGTKQNSVAQEKSIISDISYLPFGPINGYTYGNGLSHNNIYDDDYRLMGITVGGVLSRGYSYDVTDNITSITDGVSPSKNQTFTYDELNRLTSGSGIYGYQAFSYDDVGNRTGYLADNGSGAGIVNETYSYSATSNRLISLLPSVDGVPDKIRNFTYDAAGNPDQRTPDGFKYFNYKYNNANRLTSIVSAVSANYVLGSYSYNALGERVSKGVAEFYYYDELGQLLVVMNSAGAVIREYIYNNRQLVGFVTLNNLYYVHNDQKDTPQVVTSESQQVVWMADYQPFGMIQPNQNNSIELYSRFPGQYVNQETGLYYNYFRDYDPSIGRYIESDPIGLNGGINTYAYVEGDPISNIDPLGLQTTVDSWCRQNPVACAEILIPATAKPKITPTDSCPTTTPPPPPPPPKDDDDGCKKATDWQLDTLGITDPHAFKKDYVTGSLSKYDICICNGGAIKIKGAGKCGKPGPSIETY